MILPYAVRLQTQLTLVVDPGCEQILDQIMTNYIIRHFSALLSGKCNEVVVYWYFYIGIFPKNNILTQKLKIQHFSGVMKLYQVKITNEYIYIRR